MQKRSFKNDGFTLIEVLLIVATFAILLASSVGIIGSRVADEDLDAKTEEIIDIINRARDRSVTGYLGDVWSIRVLNDSTDCPANADCVVMFKGMPYSQRDSSYDQFVSLGVSTSTGAYIEGDQENEFYFTYNAGWLSTTTGTSTEQAIVLNSNAGRKKTVRINSTGLAYPFSCGDDKLYDEEGNSYVTVELGGRCWMAENLNVGTMLASAATVATDNYITEKWCEDDTASNCDAQGGLYDWDEAMGYVETEGAQGICPDGWHVPTDQELDDLVALYPSASAGTELKLNGSSGFMLIETNRMNYYTGTYDDSDLLAIWSSKKAGTYAYIHYTETANAEMAVTNVNQDNGQAIRCIEDD